MKLRNLLIIILTLTFTASSLAAPLSTSALSGSQFKAGRIIDDSKFFIKGDLSASSIQTFLNKKVPVCDTYGTKPYAGTTRKAYAASKGVKTPFICLKSFKQDTPKRSAESGLCGSMSAKESQTAAQIINSVSKACGVSTKVLLILLQKEQSLVTDDWPWPIQYRKATGYGCPDSNLPSSVDANNNGCYDQYEGFFKQVYYGARQYKVYKKYPDSFNYRAGFTSYVQWHPNAGCGGSNVTMQGHATAGLYNYTPYRPNQAALNNLYGEGNSCSSYGNRNFWRMYNDWFGSTLSTEYPSTIPGDFNGNGRWDLATRSSSTGDIDIKYGNGSGGFGSLTTYGWASGKHFHAFAGDFNSDGDYDIGLRRLSDGTIYIKYGNGSGSFGSQTTFKWAGGRHFDTFAGDFNGNGDYDIGLRRLTNGTIYIQYGNGNGNFGSQTTHNWPFFF